MQRRRLSCGFSPPSLRPVQTAGGRRLWGSTARPRGAAVPTRDPCGCWGWGRGAGLCPAAGAPRECRFRCARRSPVCSAPVIARGCSNPCSLLPGADFPSVNHAAQAGAMPNFCLCSPPPPSPPACLQKNLNSSKCLLSPNWNEGGIFAAGIWPGCNRAGTCAGRRAWAQSPALAPAPASQAPPSLPGDPTPGRDWGFSSSFWVLEGDPDGTWGAGAAAGPLLAASPGAEGSALGRCWALSRTWCHLLGGFGACRGI